MSLSAEFKRFPTRWDVLPFTEAVKDITSGNTKIPKGSYAEYGRFPIVDQGQSRYGGYTDDAEAIASVELPSIVFGDHTRAFKYIEEPFCLGADGAKILEPKVNLDKKFLFYYLKQLNIESAGYSRHYKFLKETFIPLPPLAEQKRIAAILDKADNLRRKRQQAIQLADDFLRSVFLDMFGDPVTNPKGWEVKKFGDVGTLDRGKSKHRPRNDPSLLGGNHPLIQTGDVANSGGYITEYKSSYSDMGLSQSRKWEAGTLCITIAANIAKTGILTFDACFPDSVVGFKSNGLVTVEYIQAWLGFLQQTLEASAPVSAQKNINLAILRDIDIPLPSKELQEKFSRIVIHCLANAEKKGIFRENMDLCFNSLSQKAFAGEL